jgi:hypothetical protein
MATMGDEMRCAIGAQSPTPLRFRAVSRWNAPPSSRSARPRSFAATRRMGSRSCRLGWDNPTLEQHKDNPTLDLAPETPS